MGGREMSNVMIVEVELVQHTLPYSTFQFPESVPVQSDRTPALKIHIHAPASALFPTLLAPYYRFCDSIMGHKAANLGVDKYRFHTSPLFNPTLISQAIFLFLHQPSPSLPPSLPLSSAPPHLPVPITHHRPTASSSSPPSKQD